MKKKDVEILLIEAYRAGQNSVSAMKVVDKGHIWSLNIKETIYANDKEQKTVKQLLATKLVPPPQEED